ncbi:hypothetical protein BDK51DRAFT_43510 [Blyttiomyces helicus]|uniref:Uncharacterized protein n=1 Tax=Blyttiomyces helicus TaxID=388810 RepID=A0A4P9WPG3_9FUNG|nr:hypothetical protein BDK51DRAFT_43510 [Blyttiomyces helicus]|eukprot:RKO92696.1 hypothetical protein BDK51DRAFT_43510 [Blyttiomyces helicus]
MTPLPSDGAQTSNKISASDYHSSGKESRDSENPSSPHKNKAKDCQTGAEEVRGGMNTNSRFALKFNERNLFLLNEARKNMKHLLVRVINRISAQDREEPVYKVLVDELNSADNGSHGEAAMAHAAFLGKTSKTKPGAKVRARPPAPEENEDAQAKASTVSAILRMLLSFSTDRDRLRAIVEGLSSLSGPHTDLFYEDSERSTLFIAKNYVTYKLLDIGFILLISDSEVTIDEALASKLLAADSRKTVWSQTEDLTSVNERRIEEFNLIDVVSFTRQLFRYRQWQHFEIITQLLSGPLTKIGLDEMYPKANLLAYSREIGLRTSAIRFIKVSHLERKVGFEKVENISKTFEDLRSQRLTLSPHAHAASVRLMRALSECIESDSLVSESPKLFLDAARLLWNFIDPLISELYFTQEAKEFAKLSMDSTIVLVLRFLHMLHSTFPTQEPLFGVCVGSKLALILEAIGRYSLASDVLEELADRIMHCRVELGQMMDVLASITSFTPAGPGLKDYPSVREQDLGKANLTECLRELACCHVDTYSALFRVRIKLQHSLTVKESQRSEEEALRLRHIRQRRDFIKAMPKNELILASCGENCALRAIMLSVHAEMGPNLSTEERGRLLNDAVEMLRKAEREERQLLESVIRPFNSTKTPLRCPPPSFVRRTPSSITIRPNHMRDKSGNAVVPFWYQVFCKKSGEGMTVAVSDIQYWGTGEAIRATASMEITVSGLAANESYLFAVAAYAKTGHMIGSGIGEMTPAIRTGFPLPLIFCWGYLAQVAHDSGCQDVAATAHEIMWKHFVASVPSDELLRRLFTDVSSTGDVALLLHHDFKAAVTVAPRPILRTFIQSIHSSVDRRFQSTEASVTSDAIGCRNILASQMLRLRSCRDLLLALDLSLKISDPELLLLSAIKSVQYVAPLLNLDQCPSYPTPCALPPPLLATMHVLLATHSALLRASASANDERTQVISEYLVPITFHLVTRLLSNRSPNSSLAAVHLAETTMSHINSFMTTLDLRIKNSPTLEYEWIGFVHRLSRAAARAVKKRVTLPNLADFAYHAILSVSSRPAKGYDEERRRRVDHLCEYLDYILVTAQASSMSTLVLNTVAPPQTSAVPVGVPDPITGLIQSRRCLETQTTLKDIYTVLAQIGADAVATDLLRFRKNPRFAELCARVVAYTFEVVNLPDTALRIATDAMEWLDRRNTCLLSFDSIGWDEYGGWRDNSKLRRRRRAMFSDKKTALLFTGVIRSRGKSRPRIFGVPKPGFHPKVFRTTSDPSRLFSDSPRRSRSSDSKRRSRSPSTERNRSRSPAGSVTKHSISGDNITKSEDISRPSSQLRGRSRDRSTHERDRLRRGTSYDETSNTKATVDDSASVAPVPRRESVTGAPHEPSNQIENSDKVLTESLGSDREISRESLSRDRIRRIGDDQEARDDAKYQRDLKQANLKRRRAAARNAFLFGLLPAERERRDHAARILDVVLSTTWKQRRYIRRLRAVIAFEAPWRSALALTHGQACLAHVRRESVAAGKKEVEISLFDPEWFELRRCGKILMKEFKPFSETDVSSAGIAVPIPGNAPGQTATPPASKSTAQGTAGTMPEMTRLLLEGIQSLVQSAVIASRIGHWLQVTAAVQQLFSALLTLMHRGFIVGSDFNRHHLWRAVHVAGTVILDMLCGVKVERADDDEDLFDIARERPISLQTNKEGVGFKAAQYSLPQSPIPFSTLRELESFQFVAGWVDRYGEVQSTLLDLRFCAQFLLFTVEAMAAGKQPHRLLQFSDRFDKIFNNVYYTMLCPILDSAREQIRLREARAPTAIRHPPMTRPKTLMDFLIAARGFHAKLLAELVRRKFPRTGLEKDKSVTASLLLTTEAYEEAFHIAKSRNANDIAAMACQEHGDILYAYGDFEGAIVYWSKCADTLFRRDHAVGNWKSIFSKEKIVSGPDLLALLGGVRNCFLAGMAVIKLCHVGYRSNDIDKRDELADLATRLFIAPLKGTLPHPLDPLGFCDYIPCTVFPSLDLFDDKYRSNPSILWAGLTITARNRLSVGGMNDVLIIAALMEHVASSILASSEHVAMSRMVKCDALLGLGLISESIELLLTIPQGRALLSIDRRAFGQAVFLPPTQADKFINLAPIGDPMNTQALRYLADHQLPERLAGFYGKAVSREYEVARCKLIVGFLRLAGAEDPSSCSMSSGILRLHEKVSETPRENERERPVEKEEYRDGPIWMEKEPDRMSDVESQPAPKESGFRHEGTDVASVTHAKSFYDSSKDHGDEDMLPSGSGARLRFSSSRDGIWNPTVGLGSFRPSPNALRKIGDVGALIAYLLQRIDSILGKTISELQPEKKARSGISVTSGSVEMLLRAFYLTAESHSLRGNFDTAIRCHSSIAATFTSLFESTTGDIDQNGSSVLVLLGRPFWLNVRMRMVEALIAKGYFPQASELASIGISEANSGKSTSFAIKFRTLQLVALSHRDSSSCANLSRFQTALRQLLEEIGKEDKCPVDRAFAWEAVGDSLLRLPSERRSEAMSAYRTSSEILHRISQHPSRRTRYSLILPYLLRVDVKHAQCANSANALTILNSVACLAYNSVHLSSKLMTTIALDRAYALATSRLLLDPEAPEFVAVTENANSLFIRGLEIALNDGGYDLFFLAQALCGIAVLCSDNGNRNDINSSILTGNVCYQATRCISTISGGYESRGFNIHDVGTLLLNDLICWTQEGRTEIDNIFGSEDLTKLQAGAGLIGNTTLSHLNHKVTPAKFMNFKSELAKKVKSFSGGRYASDPWESAVLARLRRAHLCLLEHASAEHVEKSVTDADKPDIGPRGKTPVYKGSPNVLPEDAASAVWSGVPLRSSICPSPPCDNRKGATMVLAFRKRQSMPPDSVAPAESYMVCTGHVPVELIREILALSLSALSDLTLFERCADEKFNDLAQTAWRSAWNFLHNYCGVDSDLALVPPLSRPAALVLRDIFDFDISCCRTICHGITVLGPESEKIFVLKCIAEAFDSARFASKS